VCMGLRASIAGSQKQSEHHCVHVISHYIRLMHTHTHTRSGKSPDTSSQVLLAHTPSHSQELPTCSAGSGPPYAATLAGAAVASLDRMPLAKAAL